MKVRRKKNIRIRKDSGFGGIIYVHHRNDFFAATYDVFQAARNLSHEYIEVPTKWDETYKELAKLGICETLDPVIQEVAYSGPSFLGIFRDIPSIEKPLVVNCFTTAFCPLKCIYCQADDLMEKYQKTESDIKTIKGKTDVKNVISTAIMIPAIVAVLTGGEPLISPDRTIHLIEGLAMQKSLVLDTSGCGDFDKLLPYLIKHDVHVRVSLDSFSNENDNWRILNPNFQNRSGSLSSRDNAIKTIEKCLNSGIGLTVQTVVHSKNDKLEKLIDLRDGLIHLGVKNWVLHIAIRGGLARKKEEEIERSNSRRGSVLPGEHVRNDLWKLIDATMKDKLDIDIRCTDTDSTPNSVLLINSEGDLFTEGLAHNGKVKLFDVKEKRPDNFRAMWSMIDWSGHSRRYLNWNRWAYSRQNLETICYSIPHPPEEVDSLDRGLSKTEKKYKVYKVKQLERILLSENFHLKSKVLQHDEYYDTKESNLEKFDYILRIRKEIDLLKYKEKESLNLNFIGPRFYAETGEYSQFVLSFSVSNEKELQKEMTGMRLAPIWFFEKKRATYIFEDKSLKVAVDEIPEIGFYIEIEGTFTEILNLEKKLQLLLGKQETRNYRDIFIDLKRDQGIDISGNEGPTFTNRLEVNK